MTDEHSERVGVNVERFGQLFEEFLEVVVHGRKRPAPFVAILKDHLGCDPASVSSSNLSPPHNE